MVNILRELNQRPIAYFPIYKHITKSVHGAILLSQMMFWFNKKDKFYKTNSDFMAELDFTERELRTAKASIKKVEFISQKVEGIPAKTYYAIDWILYEKTLAKVCNKSDKAIEDDSVITATDDSVKTTIDDSVKTVTDDTVKTITKTTTKTTTENKKINKKTLETIDKITNYLSLMTPEEISLFDEYLDVRKKIKVVTTDRIKLRLLEKYFEGGRNPEMIKRASNRNWRDFFPVKPENTQKSFKQQDKELLDSSIDAFFDAREKGFSLRNIEEPVSQYEDCEVIDYEP